VGVRLTFYRVSLPPSPPFLENLRKYFLKMKEKTNLEPKIINQIAGQKETVSIKGFPPIIIIRPGLGEMVSVKGYLTPDYTKQTEFNHAIVGFGPFFEGMKGLVPPEKRWGAGQTAPEEVLVLGYQPQYSKIINGTMDILTRIANTEGAYESQSLKEKYRRNLEEVLKIFKSSGWLEPEAEKVAVKRAGVVAAEFLHGSGKALIYEAKRLPLLDGTLGVGMDDPEKVLTPENLDGKKLEIDEVFLASGSTILAFMADCYSQKIRPTGVTIVAPFVAQQGAEAVLNFASQINWRVRIITARIYYWLNDHWYVLVTPEEAVWSKLAGDNSTREIQAGGDAGDLTEITS